MSENVVRGFGATHDDYFGQEWLGKASMSKHHKFMLVRDVHWTWMRAPGAPGGLHTQHPVAYSLGGPEVACNTS